MVKRPAKGRGASASQRAQARQALLRWHRLTRPHLRLCGAKARTTGEPCRQVAMENGRCFRHGGRTPKGDGWHKPVWPNADRPDWNDKLNRKLRDRERAAAKRAARVAAMSPAERAEYEKLRSTHRPGSAAERRRRREEREQAQRIKEQLAGTPEARPLTDLERRIAQLEERRAQIEAQRAEIGDASPTPMVDIFD